MSNANATFVVLKFGGTSVSSRHNWQNIGAIVKRHLANKQRVLIVHSALSGVTDSLEKLLTAVLAGHPAHALAELEQRHRRLAADLGVDFGEQLEKEFSELRSIAAGVALVGEVSDRTRARVMASGELLATELGVRFLQSQGFDASWADARSMLRAEARPGATERARILSATCDFTPDAALRKRLAAMTPVVVTQGFIASDDDGNTVLLGRGGSDTSAAYLAAKISATLLEIWTDVPGMFSANPRGTPTARQLLALTYEEAQEIATAGAKVLHPRCILPARQYKIPVRVLATQHPALGGTLITTEPGADAAQVKAVCIKKGVTLVSLDSPGMWHQVGFLADVFQVFKSHGMSVDLVSTSETNVTISLDPQANSLDPTLLAALSQDLERQCKVRIIGPCASVSLVGRNIRGILHQLGGALELFEEQKIYLVSQAANDLNFTFVVDEDQGDRLVQQLHELLVRPVSSDAVLGLTWEQLHAAGKPAAPGNPAWWQTARSQLLAVMEGHNAAFVYHRATIVARARALRSLSAVSRVLYAMKANPNEEIARLIVEQGVGLECVSQREVERALSVPGLARDRILFTPNFAPRTEYEWALSQGIRLTVDNLYVLRAWPELLRGREIFVRIDPGHGRGHHQHVRTGGSYSKFGIPAQEHDALAQLASDLKLRITGLHAHVGSGVFDVGSWAETAQILAQLTRRFRDVRVIDVGGGLGVPDREGRASFDMASLDARLGAVRQSLRDAGAEVELWLEPGRFIVAEAGVLLARVTQTKSKGDVRYVGIATGMNSLLRPALYGAHHDIVNLSRLDAAATEIVNVVGPICESADYLGHDRLLPPSVEGDVLLIATAGAYGRAMSSNYNLRAPAGELFL